MSTNYSKEDDEQGTEEEMQERRANGGTTIAPNATKNHTHSKQPTTRVEDLEGTTVAATWPQPVSTRRDCCISASNDDERYPRYISVPTKSRDGGAAEQGPSFSSSSKISRRNSGSGFDAFLLYSDDNVRMAEILGLRDDDDSQENRRMPRGAENVNAAAAEGELGNDHNANDNPEERNAIKRKTRISFEVHDMVYRLRYL